jgi:hypothetical protein
MASFSWPQGWFWWLVLGETIVAVSLYFAMRLKLAKVVWPSIE